MKKKVVYKKDIDYTVETGFGRMTVRLLQRGNDGLYHGASAPYPDYEQVYNEQTEKMEIVKLTRKQCIDRLLHIALLGASKVAD